MNHYPSPTSKYLATFGLAASPVTPPMDGAAAGNSGSQKSSAPALAAAGKDLLSDRCASFSIAHLLDDIADGPEGTTDNDHM